MTGDVPAAWHSLPRSAAKKKPKQPRVKVHVVHQMIRDRHEKIVDAAPSAPEPGSELDQDNKALAPYLLSGTARGAISQSLDHLEAHRALSQDAGRIHVWAQYTLMRAALETACTAVWLLSPDDADERRLRLLRLLAKDVYDSEKAYLLHGIESASGRTHDERRQELKALAPADRRSVVGSTLGYEGIVKKAASVIDVDPDYLALQWRVLSGLAHGAQWATLGMLDRSETPPDDDGVQQVRLTGSPTALALQALQVLLLLDTAEELYTRRSGAPDRGAHQSDGS